jgi:DNA-binding transcriptional LysR family regulator
MLNFNQLRIFYHVAKNLSYTLAAKDLFITQPAVTAQIKCFEDYCNLKLLKRRGREIYLTDEGKILYKYAQKIFEYEIEVDSVIEDLRKLKKGILRLGTTKTYARYFMPSLVSNFHENYPCIQIQLNEGSSQEMIESLLHHKNEIAIIAKATDHPDICFIPFSQEEVVLLLSPNHRFSRRKSIPFRELSNEPLIMKETGSGTRKLINELFEKYQCTPNIVMEIGNTEFIKQLVHRGEGISFLVKEAVLPELHENKITTIPIEEEKIFLDVSIAYIKNQPLSPSSQAFLKIIEKLAENGLPLKGIGSLVFKTGKIKI